MKILRVRLTNLNSLRGDHEVDLEAEPLGSAGIFAITGPTGAGKSTLLDAITLALYGKAARYGENQNPEDMMSRHTGECQAEVEFQVERGKYRAVWQLRRARGKADGNLQPARRYLYDANNTPLAEKIRDVDKMVMDLCGLDYHRFTRSVLLAQGEFAKFLKATADERAGLLESLTRTTIYSELGQLVHEELTARQNKLEGDAATLQMIQLLPEDLRKKREEQVGVLEDQLKLAKLNRKRLDEDRQRGVSLRSNLQHEQEALQAQVVLRTRRKESWEKLEALSRHRRAQPFFTDLAQLDHAQASAIDRSKASDALKLEANNLDSARRIALFQTERLLKSELEEGQKMLHIVEQELEQGEKRRNEAQAWLAEHSKDANLAGALPEIKACLARVTECRREEARARQMAPELPSDFHGEHGLLRARDRLSQLADQRDENQRIAALEALNEPRRQLEQLQAQLDEQRRIHARRTKEQARLDQVRQSLEEAKSKLEALREAREKAHALLQSRREHWETAKWAASLEEHQAQLEEGHPCPLCGSEEHPFVDHGRPNPKSQVAELSGLVKEGEQGLEEATRVWESANTQLVKLQTEQESCQKALDAVAEEVNGIARLVNGLAAKLGLDEPTAEKVIHRLVKCEAELEAGKKDLDLLRQLTRIVERLERQALMVQANESLAECLQPFGVAQPVQEGEESLWNSLEVRVAEYEKRQEQVRREHDLRVEAEAAAKQAANRLEILDEKSRDLRDSLAHEGERPEHLPRSPWDSLDEALKAMTEMESRAIRAGLQAKHALKEAETARDRAEQLASHLMERLQESEFESLDELRAARLEKAEEETIGRLDQELNAEAQRLEGKLEQSRSQIVKLREAKAPEGELLQQIETQVAELERNLESLTEQLTDLRGELQRDAKARETFEARSEELEEERKKLRAWEMLHGLIGSAKGQKFRLFAQGISLDLLVRHANKHLQRLTERYLLRRCPGQDLELEIEDLYQACVARPMASLSGGESFLASLALALGLSDLAGRNARIDSLFIDEGFGSLDSDALEIAISALEGLRQRNKTVGVISHVEILKERIATQIAVEKHADGTSKLVLR